jgi:hypothetical protein
MDALQQTISMAKRGVLSRSQLYALMTAHADQMFSAPGRSSAQNFTQFITKTPEGIELYAMQKSLPGKDLDEQNLPVSMAKGGGETDWTRLVSQVRKSANCSENEAITSLLKTEIGLHTFQRAKRADQVASQMFSIADIQAQDAAAGRQQENRDFHKTAAADDKDAYEQECDVMRRAHPDMTESDIHDAVARRNLQSWLDHKTSNLGGKKSKLPSSRGQYQTSGEDPPEPTSGRGKIPAPEWRSDHSTVTPTTPRHEPEQLSDKPSVKAMAKRMSPQRAIEFYKKFPPFVRQALDTALSEGKVED